MTTGTIARHEFWQDPNDDENPACRVCDKARGHDGHFPIIRQMEERSRPTRELLFAIGIAQGLSGGADADSEYARGQAELICDLFHLSMEEDMPVILNLITKE